MHLFVRLFEHSNIYSITRLFICMFVETYICSFICFNFYLVVYINK
nr:MAG TPA: hypothetical protein [Caudoviricetes sp.]